MSDKQQTGSLCHTQWKLFHCCHLSQLMWAACVAVDMYSRPVQKMCFVLSVKDGLLDLYAILSVLKLWWNSFLYPISLLQHTLVVFCVVLDFPSTIWTSHFCSFLLLLRAIISSVPITAVAKCFTSYWSFSGPFSFVWHFSYSFFLLISFLFSHLFCPNPFVCTITIRLF